MFPVPGFSRFQAARGFTRYYNFGSCIRLARRSCSTGFTLIELLVAIGLFAVVTSLAVGGFANALRTERQTTGLLSANSNVSLTIEQMTREMRTGYNFCITPNLCTRTDQVIFKNARGEKVTYERTEDGAIERQAIPASGGAAPFERITSDNVKIAHLEFYVSGNIPGDGLQPRITIAIGVSSREQNLANNVINLQTTVSPRVPLDT